MASALKSNWPVVGSALLAAGLSSVAYRSFVRQQAKAGKTAKAADAKDAKAADAKPTFVIVQHNETVPPAFLLDFLKAKGARVRIVRLESEPLPALKDLNAAADVVVSLGGHMGAYEDALYPQWMPAEKQLMRDCVAQDVPILGICLGAQLLADALGGKAFPAAAFEGGFVPIARTDAGKSDSVLGAAFKQPVLLHHGDTFTLPPKAVLLATTVYPQAFRLGSALAVQFHPEARLGELERWSATEGAAKRYASVGLTRDGLLADAKRVAADQLAASQAFFDAWWSALPSKYTGATAAAAAEPQAAAAPAAAVAAVDVKSAAVSLPPVGVAGTKHERSFIALKPDAVQRGLIGAIVKRFEQKGYKLVAMKFLQPTEQQAKGHYDDLKATKFFAGLTRFFASGPIVAMVWEGEGVIAGARKMMGATKPADSAPGTIRGDFCVNVGRNIIHGSDSAASAAKEIAFWFAPEEVITHTPTVAAHIYE